MAIQVSGTTVVDNSRNLTNIVGADISGRLQIKDVAEGTYTTADRSGTIGLNNNTNAILRATSSMNGNFVLNIVTDMDVNDSCTCAFIAPMSSTAYYCTSLQVNGTTSGVSTRWIGGAPTEGTANADNVYTFTVIETSTNNYLVLATLSAFEA